MAARRHHLRDWVISMYRRGDLCSIAEGALIASVPRQTVGRWVREAEINIEATRQRYLARSQLRAERYAEGLPPVRKPSKAQMRSDIDKAMRRRSHAAKPGPA